MLMPGKARIEREFFAKIEDIPNKNKGGCLLFCYLFYKWLEDSNYSRKSFAIVQYDSGTYSIKHNIRFLNGEVKHAGSSAHFTWKYRGRQFDSDGRFIESETRYVDYQKHKLAIVDMDKFCVDALTHGGWNDDFDRLEAIVKINDRFNFSFSDLI